MADGTDLSGRTALVTGATAGLGRVIAVTLAARGARVAVHGRTREATDPVVAIISEAGGAAVGVHADLSDAAAAAARLVDQAEAQLGAIDLLVNCAADQRLDAAAARALDVWRQILEVNLLAAVDLTRLVCQRAPRPADVSVVHAASVEALAPFPGHAAYAASKAALVSFTAAAAGELAPSRINAVAPGLIDRPGLAEAWPRGVEWWAEVTPLRRPVESREVAEAVAFLSSPAASGITGVTLPVDGGWASSARTSGPLRGV